MTTTEEVPMPGPVGSTTYFDLQYGDVVRAAYTADQLRAYADARCAKLRAELVEAMNAEMQARRERDALAEKVKAMEADARRLDSGAIRLHDRDEYGDAYAVVYSGVDLRAAIDAAGDQP